MMVYNIEYYAYLPNIYIYFDLRSVPDTDFFLAEPDPDPDPWKKMLDSHS